MELDITKLDFLFKKIRLVLLSSIKGIKYEYVTFTVIKN